MNKAYPGFTESEVVADQVVTRYAWAGSEGPAVLLVHGRGIGASGATDWHGLLPLLSRAGFRVYAPDQLSMGWTDLRPHAWPVNGYDSLVAHMLAFLDAMQIERAFVIGSSMGAYVAARLALDHPRRVRAAVMIGSTTLSAAMGLLHTPAPKMSEEHEWNRDGIRQQLLKQFARPAAITEQMLEARVAAAARPGVREATASFVAFLNILACDEAAKATFLIKDRLPLTNLPMRLVWGEEDRIAPVALAHRLTSVLPAIPCEVIPRAGHLCHIEAAEAVAEIVVPFLRQNG
jgi:2-hydroxy-6-oxonona-2,4-dienedioate hydrolase